VLEDAALTLLLAPPWPCPPGGSLLSCKVSDAVLCGCPLVQGLLEPMAALGRQSCLELLVARGHILGSSEQVGSHSPSPLAEDAAEARSVSRKPG